MAELPSEFDFEGFGRRYLQAYLASGYGATSQRNLDLRVIELVAPAFDRGDGSTDIPLMAKLFKMTEFELREALRSAAANPVDPEADLARRLSDV